MAHGEEGEMKAGRLLSSEKGFVRKRVWGPKCVRRESLRRVEGRSSVVPTSHEEGYLPFETAPGPGPGPLGLLAQPVTDKTPGPVSTVRVRRSHTPRSEGLFEREQTRVWTVTCVSATGKD